MAIKKKTKRTAGEPLPHRQFFPALGVGVAQTFSGGVAIGGDGKLRASVKAIAKQHGMKMHPNTGEWFTPDGARFAEILYSLEAVEG